ncbi:diaminopimelate epimerase [Haloglomus salinum]|jgi:diaminopimelate epimerase|uniref:diaminopimelate epimerase n=1 Tax=Haloglomus salinum TaxID=2962673 RepID=UPI0020CA1674|nr:diaminopimelate epimerase [Haloglomus salinum]
MVHIQKYHGTGNDFVVVDAAERVGDRRAFARALCDRTTGISHPDSPHIGADGVLFLHLETEYASPRVVMTLVQPDGSVAAMCGNGARCAARWAAERTGSDEVMIDTQSGTRRAVIAREAPDDGNRGHGDDRGFGDDVTIEMGRPRFLPGVVPVQTAEPLVQEHVEGLTVTAVNTGVPHAVSFVEDVDAVDLEDIAPAVRHADVFPEGANVTLASRVAPTGDEDAAFRQRTYERGVEGETDSCGTGAVAIAAVAHRLGRIGTGETVRVTPPGGDLFVTVTDDDALLRGPAVFEFEAEVPEPGVGPDAELDVDLTDAGTNTGD